MGTPIPWPCWSPVDRLLNKMVGKDYKRNKYVKDTLQIGTWPCSPNVNGQLAFHKRKRYIDKV